MGLAELKQKEKDFYRQVVDNEMAEIILGSGALKVSFENPFIFSFGLESPMKIEADEISQHPDFLAKTADCLSRLMDLEGLNPEVIVGVISGAVPFARRLAEQRGCRFAARLGRKRTELQSSKVEGIIAPGERALVLDDVLTTGGNIGLVVDQVRQEGGMVTDCLVIYDYGFPLARKNLSQQGISVHNATGFEAVTKSASSLLFRLLTPEEKNRLAIWHQNTQETSR